jgi:hypothetical protein
MAEPAEIHLDDAIDHLARQLAAIPVPRGQLIPPHQRPDGCDISVREIASVYWRPRGVQLSMEPEHERYFRPFYDAAWDLCRMGVLRPGGAAPRQGIHGGGFQGDGYSLTAFGYSWVKAASERPPTDPSRFAEVLASYAHHFGGGFLQRGSEAARCYMTANYFACCAMAGAAAEAILLAIAIAKLRDHERALSEYRSSGGRSKVTNRIVGNVTRGLKEQFLLASGVLSYWRDESAHGTHSKITEVHAQSSLAQLLRFAQLVSDHWSELAA